MEKEKFEKLLLKTAFSFMACDGKIDASEVSLVKSLASTTDLFGDLNVTEELDKMLVELNDVGGEFLRGYFDELTSVSLSEEEELKLIKVSIDTINADNIIEYSEVKFFKIVRDKLAIHNDSILALMPEIEEYLEQDIISHSYISNLTRDYLGTFAAPAVGSIKDISADIEKIKKEKR
jgi:uncharacterized tellurite resistance protein B-like protein